MLIGWSRKQETAEGLIISVVMKMNEDDGGGGGGDVEARALSLALSSVRQYLAQ